MSIRSRQRRNSVRPNKPTDSLLSELKSTPFLDRFESFSREITPSEVDNMLRAGESGILSFLYDYFLRMRTTDTRIAGLVNNRRMAVAQQPWDVTAGDAENELSVEIATFIRSNLEMLDVTELRRMMFDGILDGMKFFTNEFWRDDEGRLYLESITPISQSRYGFYPIMGKDHNWGEPSINLNAGLPVPISQLPDWQVTKCVYQRKDGYYDLTGIMRPCVRWYVIKFYAINFWMEFAETYGFPIATLSMAEDKFATQRAEMETFLADVGRNKYALYKEGMNFELHDSQRSTSVDTFKQLVDMANTEMAIALNGQNLTTEVKGGSFAAASVHLETFQSLVADDIRWIDGIINSQIVDMLVAYNWPSLPYELYPKFTTISEPDINQSEAVRTLQMAVAIPGFSVPVDEAYKMTGIRKPEEGEATLSRSTLLDVIDSTI